MADPAATECSVLDSAEGCSNSHPSQHSAASSPTCQDSKRTNAGSNSPKRSRKKAKTENMGRCGQSSEKTPHSSIPTVTSHGSLQPGVCSKLPKPKIDLRALFDYYFVRKQHKKLRNRWLHQKETKTYWKRKRVPVVQQPKIPAAERNRRFRERGLRFPFVEKLCGRKDIPFKLVCRYEQAALHGYLRYIETLKCEHHLKKSLAKLNAGDELENESLESRKYSYLDDDGPLSPIEETSEDQNETSGNDDIGARIVETSSFVLSKKIIEKKKSKKTSRN